MKSLAIIVTTVNHADRIKPCVQAALKKGIAVRIHLTGQGVLLITHADLAALGGECAITVCRDSAKNHGLLSRIASCRYLRSVPCSHFVHALEQCDRQLLF